MDPSAWADQLGGVSAARQFDRIAYFHVDHFEPQALVGSPIWPLSLSAILADQPAPMSIFVYPAFAVALKDDADPRLVVDEDERDPIVFCRYSRDADMRAAVQAALEAGADLHVHLHHELWTRTPLADNSKVCETGETALDAKRQRLRDWVLRESDEAQDGRRFSRALRLYRSWLSEVANRDVAPFGFVHGCWALAASDPTVCTLNDEIPRLFAGGAIADFSFPAGRSNCDPLVKEPFCIRPLPGVRIYDSGAAILGPARHHPPDYDSEFLIWSSDRTAWYPSLDYKSAVIQTAATGQAVLDHLLDDAPVIGRTCYLRTHAHSLDLAYWRPVTRTPLQRFRPILDSLRNAAEKASIRFDTVTVRDVLAELAAHRNDPPLPSWLS